jgi:hypothetical protein
MIARLLIISAIASLALSVADASAEPDSAATSSDPLYQLSMEELLELKVSSATLSLAKR